MSGKSVHIACTTVDGNPLGGWTTDEQGTHTPDADASARTDLDSAVVARDAERYRTLRANADEGGWLALHDSTDARFPMRADDGQHLDTYVDAMIERRREIARLDHDAHVAEDAFSRGYAKRDSELLALQRELRIALRRYTALREFTNSSDGHLVVVFARNEPDRALDGASELDAFADQLGPPHRRPS